MFLSYTNLLSLSFFSCFLSSLLFALPIDNVLLVFYYMKSIEGKKTGNFYELETDVGEVIRPNIEQKEQGVIAESVDKEES